MYFLEDLKEEEKQLLELNKNITKDIIPSIKEFTNKNLLPLYNITKEYLITLVNKTQLFYNTIFKNNICILNCNIFYLLILLFHILFYRTYASTGKTSCTSSMYKTVPPTMEGSRLCLHLWTTMTNTALMSSGSP